MNVDRRARAEKVDKSPRLLALKILDVLLIRYKIYTSIISSTQIRRVD